MPERTWKSNKFQSAVGVLAGLVCLGTLALLGCDSVTDCDCEDEIDDLLNRRGTPSDFAITESADYNRHEYTYYNADGSTDTYIFEWGDEDEDGNTIDVCCRQTSTRTSADGEEEEIENSDESDEDTDDTEDSDEDTDDTEES